MLRLITGKAGAGKTAAINKEIASYVEKKTGEIYLVVPEQYSHEAERELCRTCGDSLSLYAEVLSFTGLARKIFAKTGGTAAAYIDKGGKMLCMTMAVKLTAEKLNLFGPASGKPELQNMLLQLVDEMKTSCITPDMLLAASEKCSGELRKKLFDIALISEAYNGILENSGADPADMLSVLAEKIEESPLNDRSRVYVDGFTDFTGAEMNVLREMLKKNVDITVCLTLDDLYSGNEIYALSRSAANELLKSAEAFGVRTEIKYVQQENEFLRPMRILAENVFSYSEAVYSAGDCIRLFRCESIAGECELAAAAAIEYARENGNRWRDTAIAVRNFEEYADTLEAVFAEYGVPLYTARRIPVAERPLPALISCAYSIILGGWKPDDVISYLDTGLTGLSFEERDELTEYIHRWAINERLWHSVSDWSQHPDGYGIKADEISDERLARINDIRRRVAAPLLKFEASSHMASDAENHVLALTQLFADLDMAQLLENKANGLEARKDNRGADEYRQLWGIIVSSLEQAYFVLGKTVMKTEEFSKLFLRALSKYDVGTIPASLDAVTAGDFDRMRRRNIKNLIILGASDDRLPAQSSEKNIFSQDELRELNEAGTCFGADPDAELWREYMLIYNCLSLPGEHVLITCAANDSSGSPARPSVVMTRAERLFGMEIKTADIHLARCAAPLPAMRTAALSEGETAKALEVCFEGEEKEHIHSVKVRANALRGKLSREGVESLYGRKMKISASRAERFYACRYAFFCEYGLKLKKHKKSEFAAAEMGTFTHFVLENTARDIKTNGGFSEYDDENIASLVQKYIARYEETELDNFREKSERFKYLFKRAEKNIVYIAQDMARELRSSKFEPLAFELDFGNRETFGDIRVNAGEDMASITGIADRVDGWDNNGTVYLRVADYKTGKKKFSLSDLWYGKSMQMLLYLYALEMNPEITCRILGLEEGRQINSAGVEYIPAREQYVSASFEDTAEQIESRHMSQKHRSGLILDLPEVESAWQTGDDGPYSLIKRNRDGAVSKNSKGITADEKHFALLYALVKKRLGGMSSAIRAGAIEADPAEKKTGDNVCQMCDYAGKCGFCDGEKNESYRETPEIDDNEKLWEMITGEIYPQKEE